MNHGTQGMIMTPATAEIVQRALRGHTVVPGFNIPYLPMVEPVVRALRDTNSFGLVMVARLEWEKFESGSLEAVCAEYRKHDDRRHTRLHLDGRALHAGYESVMVDGSRLPLAENISCTARIVKLAHAAGVPVEAELGAVLGHEAGPLPPYEELFASGKGFTDPVAARQFVEDTGVDWLSVAIGNIHGAISAAAKGRQKVAARLDIEHLARINRAAGVPLVLHGGTGIRKEYVLDAIRHGIAKINVATAIRQPYEQAVGQGVGAAQDAVYRAMLTVIREDLEIENSVFVLNPEESA